MRVCMFLLSICLFTTLSIKRRSKLYPVGNRGLEQIKIAEAGADDIINAKKQLVLVTHKRTLYDTDDDSVVSSKKRFLTTGIPAALLILSLHQFCAAYLERQLVYCIKCQSSQLFNKGSPDRKLTISFSSFYLKNHLRLFPFLLLAPDTRLTFSVRKQLSSQKDTPYSTPLCSMVSNPLLSFFMQGYRLFSRRHEKTLASKPSPIFVCLSFPGYHPP